MDANRQRQAAIEQLRAMRTNLTALVNDGGVVAGTNLVVAEEADVPVPIAAMQEVETVERLAIDPVPALTPTNSVSEEARVVDERRLPLPTPAFGIKVETLEGRNCYVDGETIRYKIQCDAACHVAVFCHQVDGTSVVLFPNAWQGDSWVPAGEVVEIPGAGRGGFALKIGPPFGMDVVQVVACTTRSALHRLVSENAGKLSGRSPFGVVTRGVLAEVIRPEPEEEEKPARWADACLVIRTEARAE